MARVVENVILNYVVLAFVETRILTPTEWFVDAPRMPLPSATNDRELHVTIAMD